MFPYEMENKAREEAQSMGHAVFAGITPIDKLPPSGVPMSVYYPRKRGFRMLIEELENESSGIVPRIELRKSKCHYMINE